MAHVAAAIEFRKDRTGTLHTWGALIGQEILDFRWEQSGALKVIVFFEGEWEEEQEEPEVISYDFYMRKGTNQVCLYQVNYDFGGGRDSGIVPGLWSKGENWHHLSARNNYFSQHFGRYNAFVVIY